MFQIDLMLTSISGECVKRLSQEHRSAGPLHTYGTHDRPVSGIA